MSRKDTVCLTDNGIDAGNNYYFRQWAFREHYLALFTDLNIHFWRKIREVVKKQKIDLIFVTMTYGVTSASIMCRNIPLIYDSHGVMGDAADITFTTIGRLFKILNKVPFIRNIVELSLKGYISTIERLACNRATHIKAICNSDKKRFIEKYNVNEDKITVIPPFISPLELEKASVKKKSPEKNNMIKVVFHGSYAHPPNHGAFELILNYIAPEVGKRNGNIQFLLAGTDVPVFERENVKSLGFVRDIQTVLVNSDIAIVPLSEGEGVKTKIFDYMAAGLPIISTRKGIQAIEAENGIHAVILNAVDRKFIDAILDLADDGNKREKLGRNAFELARAKYSQESMQAKMNEMIAKVIKSQNPKNAQKPKVMT